MKKKKLSKNLILFILTIVIVSTTLILISILFSTFVNKKSPTNSSISNNSQMPTNTITPAIIIENIDKKIELKDFTAEYQKSSESKQISSANVNSLPSGNTEDKLITLNDSSGNQVEVLFKYTGVEDTNSSNSSPIEQNYDEKNLSYIADFNGKKVYITNDLETIKNADLYSEKYRIPLISTDSKNNLKTDFSFKKYLVSINLIIQKNNFNNDTIKSLAKVLNDFKIS
jgi:hypothetical protein